MNLTNMVFEETVGDETRNVIVSKKGTSFIFERNGQPSFVNKADAVRQLVQSCLDADKDYPTASESLRSRHERQLETAYTHLLEMLV